MIRTPFFTGATIIPNRRLSSIFVGAVFGGGGSGSIVEDSPLFDNALDLANLSLDASLCVIGLVLVCWGIRGMKDLAKPSTPEAAGP